MSRMVDEKMLRDIRDLKKDCDLENDARLSRSVGIIERLVDEISELEETVDEINERVQKME